VITDKLVAKIPATYAGKVLKLHHKAEELCQVGQALLDMEVADDVGVKDESHHEETSEQKPPEQKASKGAESETKEQEPVVEVDDSNILTTFAVRRLAKNLKVNLNQVKGSGKHGRVTKDDVFAFVESGGKPAPSKAPAKRPVKTEAPPVSKADKVVKLKGTLRAMVKSMTEATTIPHESMQEEIVMSKLNKKCKDYMEKNPNVKLHHLAFFVKAISCALTHYPILNSHVTENRDNEGILVDYVEKANHNVSILIDTPSGLLVPSIKSVQTKSIVQINEEILQLISKAKNATLSESDLSDGTITLSTTRNLGGRVASPLIFKPQVAGVFIGKGRLIPEFKEVKGVTKVYPMEVSSVCVSADRRVVDPAVLTRFVNLFKQYIDELNMLLLNLK